MRVKPINPKRNVAFFIAEISIIVIAIAFGTFGLGVLVNNGSDVTRTVGSKVDDTESLRLTPKANLYTVYAKEGENWTHVPNVPPAIHRNKQVRLVVEWEANEFVRTLDPATEFQYQQWGFEGSSPGPVLRVRQGDLVEVRLTNNLRSVHSHNIDFHFATGPGGGAKALNVAPGETAIVELRALVPGFYMYHCATPDIPTHIANGMYGFIIVEPRGGFPRVDHEFAVVQSEFYPTSNGGVETLDVAKLDSEQPDYVVFNGAVGALTGDASPKTKVGDSVRVWFGNAGPQLTGSFHVIGETFDRVLGGGKFKTANDPQVVGVPVSGGTAVEFTVDVPGTYILVDHAIARSLHKGSVGTMIVEGKANPEVFAEVRPASGGNDHGTDPHEPSVTTPPATTPTNVEVRITKGAWNPKNAARAYSPNVIHVKVGQTVRWVNDDPIPHTVTADDNSFFDSGNLKKGQKWSYTFTATGTYKYHCTPHPYMKGTVIVEE